jgi:hypothetical protein
MDVNGATRNIYSKVTVGTVVEVTYAINTNTGVILRTVTFDKVTFLPFAMSESFVPGEKFVDNPPTLAPL